MTAAAPQSIPEPVTKRVSARVGLLGNPSDGFKGAVVSFSLQNFWAEVRGIDRGDAVCAFKDFPSQHL